MSKKLIKSYQKNFDLICENYKKALDIKDVDDVSSIAITEIDNENKKIEFIYYDNYQTLRKWINSFIIHDEYKSDINNIEKVFEKIGVFIAKYHTIAFGSNQEKKEFREKNKTNIKIVKSFLHSDLTDQNILINSKYEVIIIDWESTSIVDYFFNYGNIQWDLVWFSNTLLRPSPRTFFNTNIRVNLVISFLKGYNSIQKINIDCFYQFYDMNIYNLTDKIYNKKNILNKILLKKHKNNWIYLKKRFKDFL